jgi:protein tyrosine/serine phosphatase
LFFCKAGKDRTGLVAALLLLLLGATPDAVLDDYVRSDAYHMVALAGLENDPNVTGLNRAVFERAPRAAMAHALEFLDAEAGGVQAYLERAGLGANEQNALRHALLLPTFGGEREAPAAVAKTGVEVIRGRL